MRPVSVGIRTKDVEKLRKKLLQHIHHKMTNIIQTRQQWETQILTTTTGTVRAFQIERLFQ